jgi:hypothetical protein
MIAPSTRARQFRVLFRDFLGRMIDLEVLSTRGEPQSLLAQFAAMLAAVSFVFAVYLVPRYGTSPLPRIRLLTLAWLDEEFLIGTTMLIAGMFSVLAWNAVMPDKRDALVLGPLPVKTGTVFRAKAAALAVTLSAGVVAVNLFTGIAYPAVLAPHGGFLGFLRSLAAYWIVMAAAGTFICAALLALQGIAAQALPYRVFQRVSSFLQMAAFFVILGAYFLKPPLATVAGITSPAHRTLISSMPTYWFLGLFQVLNGSLHPAFGALAARALSALAIAVVLAAAAGTLAFRRGLRRVIEQPDIAPSRGLRLVAQTVRWLADRCLPQPIDRAIVLFTARTLARSRQHRLILAAYAGIALAIALAYLKSFLYSGARSAGDTVPALLAPGVVMILFAAIGARAAFAFPISLPANWIFRVTAIHSPEAYFSAARKALACAAVIPVWIVSAAAYLVFRPSARLWEHVVLLALLGAILTFTCTRRFHKIPFACSYLPGKANLRVKLGIYGILFLFFCDTGVRVEAAALRAPRGFAILLAILAAAALGAWLRARMLSAAPFTKLQFEELPATDLLTLELKPPAHEAYLAEAAPVE